MEGSPARERGFPSPHASGPLRNVAASYRERNMLVSLVVPWTSTSGGPSPLRDPRPVARPHMLEDAGSFSHRRTVQRLICRLNLVRGACLHREGPSSPGRTRIDLLPLRRRESVVPDHKTLLRSAVLTGPARACLAVAAPRCHDLDDGIRGGRERRCRGLRGARVWRLGDRSCRVRGGAGRRGVSARYA